MINKLLFAITARLPARLINVNGAPYLERYYVGQMCGATIYLHRFVSADRERHLHNHPWVWGRALVLSGSYGEEVVTDLTTQVADGCTMLRRRVRWWNRIDGNHFHRIADAAPGTWTLMVHGPRKVRRFGMTSRLLGWGFLETGSTPDGERVTYYREHKRTLDEALQWWLTAPLGRDVGRVPLGEERF